MPRWASGPQRCPVGQESALVRRDLEDKIRSGDTSGRELVEALSSLIADPVAFRLCLQPLVASSEE